MTEQSIQGKLKKPLLEQGVEAKIGDCAALQPCSGIKVIMPRVFASGHGVATPDIVGKKIDKNAA